MIKSKLLKAIILGVCLSALYTTAVSAESGAGVTPAVRGEVEIYSTEPFIDTGLDPVAVEKQREIDLYLFKEHAKDIEKKGFKVTHTAPMQGYVEIGIHPYNEENAAYLYEIFGKDMVKVVEGEEAVLVALPAIAPDTPVSSREPAPAAGNANSSVEIDVATDAILYMEKDGSEQDAVAATGAADDTILLTTTNATAESATASNITVIALGAGGAVILLGGAAIAVRRLKASTK